MENWKYYLKNEFNKDYYKNLMLFLEKEYKEKNVYPKKNDIFKALTLTNNIKIKIVILGQDPYHTKGMANGLAFSVNKGMKIPPSLKNIYKELTSSLNVETDINNINLENWAKQGVLLLNTSLTVVEGKPNSHKNIGWTNFTNKIITIVNNQSSPSVFMLWGNNAKNKDSLITNKKHMVLKSVHPSPLSAHNGFFGCNHFKLANEFLINNNISPIDFFL